MVLFLSFDSALTFSDKNQAILEFRSLIHELESAGFQTQVRHGYGASLLVCIRFPRDLLGNMVHKARYVVLFGPKSD